MVTQMQPVQINVPAIEYRQQVVRKQVMVGNRQVPIQVPVTVSKQFEEVKIPRNITVRTEALEPRVSQRNGSGIHFSFVPWMSNPRTYSFSGAPSTTAASPRFAQQPNRYY